MSRKHQKSQLMIILM